MLMDNFLYHIFSQLPCSHTGQIFIIQGSHIAKGQKESLLVEKFLYFPTPDYYSIDLTAVVYIYMFRFCSTIDCRLNQVEQSLQPPTCQLIKERSHLSQHFSYFLSSACSLWEHLHEMHLISSQSFPFLLLCYEGGLQEADIDKIQTLKHLFNVKKYVV